MTDNEKKTLAFEQELYEKHFRVSIFGSARIKKDDEIYRQVVDLAKEIGENGFDVVTGGGPGIMEAANCGHNLGDPCHRSNSIGIRIKLPYEEQHNRHLELEKQFKTFSKRLDHFMALSNAVVVMPGGIGTCLELFYTWQLTQVNHIKKIPIILMGEMWKDLLEWAKSNILEKERMNPEDLHNLFWVKDNHEAMKIINDTYKKYSEEDESAISSYVEYISESSTQ